MECRNYLEHLLKVVFVTVADTLEVLYHYSTALVKQQIQFALRYF